MPGKKIGEWTIDSIYVDPAPKYRKKVVCRCSCGVTKTICFYSLRRGETKSCGHLRKHGLVKTGTHNSWKQMKDRCLNPNAPNYPIYGGAGVTVCTRWLSFKFFLADMGPRPAGKTLDRINNDGNYEPGNCRWATPVDQSANRSATVFVVYENKKTPLSKLARQFGIDIDVLRNRIFSLDWNIELALNKQVKKYKPRESARP